MLRRIREGYGQELLEQQQLLCSKNMQFCCLFGSYCYSSLCLISSSLLVLGKADLGNDLSIMDRILMFLPMVRCYIDGGDLNMVGEGKGHPDGGWERNQDDRRSERSVNAFVVVVRQRQRKKIWAQVCHGEPSVEKCLVTGAPSFSLRPSQFLEHSVGLEMKSNQGGLFPVPTIDLCQQSGVASPLWTFWARLATNCCWGFKNPENHIITTSMNLQWHCAWLSVCFDLPGELNHS